MLYLFKSTTFSKSRSDVYNLSLLRCVILLIISLLSEAIIKSKARKFYTRNRLIVMVLIRRRVFSSI